jgi:hypothetical protein
VVVTAKWAVLAPLVDKTSSATKAALYLDGSTNNTAYKFNVKKLSKVGGLRGGTHAPSVNSRFCVLQLWARALGAGAA